VYLCSESDLKTKRPNSAAEKLVNLPSFPAISKLTKNLLANSRWDLFAVPRAVLKTNVPTIVVRVAIRAFISRLFISQASVHTGHLNVLT